MDQTDHQQKQPETLRVREGKGVITSLLVIIKMLIVALAQLSCSVNRVHERYSLRTRQAVRVLLHRDAVGPYLEEVRPHIGASPGQVLLYDLYSCPHSAYPALMQKQ